MDIKFEQLSSGLQERIDVNENGCWIWKGGVSRGGRAITTVLGETWKVAKLIHTFFIAPVPPEFEASHLCPNKLCCRPHSEHVIMESHDDNMKRTRISETKTCRKGHDMTGDNAVIKGTVLRCLICFRESGKKRRAKKRGNIRFTS